MFQDPKAHHLWRVNSENLHCAGGLLEMETLQSGHGLKVLNPWNTERSRNFSMAKKSRNHWLLIKSPRISKWLCDSVLLPKPNRPDTFVQSICLFILAWQIAFIYIYITRCYFGRFWLNIELAIFQEEMIRFPGNRKRTYWLNVKPQNWPLILTLAMTMEVIYYFFISQENFHECEARILIQCF